MIQYLILYTVGSTGVQQHVLAASNLPTQEVVERFIRSHKNYRFVAIYKMELQEVKL